MSSGLNKVLLIGNLAADSELKITQGGTSVLKFRIGCTDHYIDKAGAKQEKTEWVSCVMWGKAADALSKYLVKGKQVFVEGKLQTTSWEDKEGQKRYKTEVNVSSITLLGGGRAERYTPEAEPEQPSKMWNGKAAETFDYPVNDEDLPF